MVRIFSRLPPAEEKKVLAAFPVSLSLLFSVPYHCLPFFFFISSSFFKYSAHENNGAQQIKANKQTAFKRHRCCGHVEFGEVEIPSPAIYFFFNDNYYHLFSSFHLRSRISALKRSHRCVSPAFFVVHLAKDLEAGRSLSSSTPATVSARAVPSSSRHRARTPPPPHATGTPNVRT